MIEKQVTGLDTNQVPAEYMFSVFRQHQHDHWWMAVSAERVKWHPCDTHTHTHTEEKGREGFSRSTNFFSDEHHSMFHPHPSLQLKCATGFTSQQVKISILSSSSSLSGTWLVF